MVVRVHEPGQYGHRRKIDDARARGNLDVRTDVANARPFDEDDLIREDAAGFRIEQSSRADRGERRGRRRLRPDWRDDQAHQSDCDERSHECLRSGAGDRLQCPSFVGWTLMLLDDVFPAASTAVTVMV